MTGLILLGVFLLAVALFHGYLESFRAGPSHCMGCGKCDHNGGICILTGRPLGKTISAEKTSPLTNGKKRI